MILTNPLGLLALLSIPAILALHFFRERKKVKRIGGLHLWDFAAIRLPAGRRLDRLVKNLSLLFQLLAALFLSLLIAGLDLPEKAQVRHYTIILDDSVSMRAGGSESAAQGAKKVLGDWARQKDRFTLITAGLRPEMQAGPFGERDHLIRALRQWTPQSPSCGIEQAVNLASKFVTGPEKILFFTDDPSQAATYQEILEIYSLGRPASNQAITFADRTRTPSGKDKIFITVRSFSDVKVQTTLVAGIKERVLFERELDLPTEAPVNLSFETDATQESIELSLPDDALLADNSVTLAPVAIKPVIYYIEGLEQARESFTKAAEVIPYTHITNQANAAHLVFTTQQDYMPSGRNVRVFILPKTPVKGETGIAQGRDIVLFHASALTEGLSLEGVLWPYAEKEPQGDRPLMSHRGVPLLSLEAGGEHFKKCFLNLLWDRTNIYRHTSWPILMLSIFEDCREAIPGLSRTNFKVGESIRLRLKEGEGESTTYRLFRDGKVFAEYDLAPEILQDLPPGHYEFSTNHGKPVAGFRVNLFAPSESDLRRLKSKKAELESLAPTVTERPRRNMLLFYMLLISVIIFTALSWMFQDTYR